jgi:flagellar biosynthesis protein FlhF
MHVKRLYRPTVREALAAAREQLGPGALVLSTELVPAPGWRGWIGQRDVRLTAATERATDAGANPAVVSSQRPDMTAQRHRVLSTPQAGVAARLEAAGLAAPLAEAVAGRLSSSACRGGSPSALRGALAAEIESFWPDSAGPAFTTCEVFVGPPGAGKTTTIAKIAAQQRVTGGRQLVLVAADAYRAGAIEQLKSYANVVGAPLRVARTPAELGAALEAARHPALVDTAGRSPRDSSLSELFQVFQGRTDVRTHLVLAADTSLATARRVFDQYAELRPSHVVITKIDEASSVVPLFNLVRDRGLPVSFLAAGQRVPEDLQRATPACLAAALLEAPAGEAA